MKKLLLVLALVIISMTSMAEEVWFTATHIAFKSEYQSEYDPWKECSIPIMIDVERKRIVINSKEQQIIDWVSLEERNSSDSSSKYYTSLATDTNYKTIRIELWYQDRQMVVRVNYNGIHCQYRIPKTSYN